MWVLHYCPNLRVQNFQGVVSQSMNQPYHPNEAEGPSGIKGLRRPKSQGKVCMMTLIKAKNRLHVITGSLLLCNSPNLVLFDLGAMHSFISISHAKSLDHEIEPLEGGILVSTASDEAFMVESVCRNCEIRIKNVTLKVDFILFELHELDVILAMDFLNKYHFVVDGFNKKVLLRELEKNEVKFVGYKKVELASRISVLKVTNMIRKGHTTYLAQY